MELLNVLDGYKPYEEIKSALSDNLTPVSVSGLVESAQIHVISALSKEKTALVVVYSDYEARIAAREFAVYSDRVFVFCEKEYVFYNIDARGHEREYERLCALNAIRDGGIIIAPVAACLSYTLPAEKFLDFSMSFNVGERYDVEQLCAKLVDMGYRREDMTEATGQFSLRGGILDVFSPSSKMPVRIEFFDDEIDSIRFFDSDTQRTVSQQDSCSIIPASELCLSRDEREKVLSFITRYSKRKTCSDELKEVLLEEKDLLSEGLLPPAIDKYIGLVYEKIPTICDYLTKDTLVFLLEPKRINERAKTYEWEQGEVLSDLSSKKMMAGGPGHMWMDYKTLCEHFSSHKLVSINLLAHSSIDYQYKKIVDFITKSTVSFHGKIDYLLDDLKSWKSLGFTVVILTASNSRGENLCKTLRESGFEARFCRSLLSFEKGEIVVASGGLKKGFEYPEIGFVVIAEQDIFIADKKRRERKADATNRIKSYTDIHVGDYVVHRAHGIGEYAGITKMQVSGVTKDYLKIKYFGTDTLYVPVDQMDMLYKYVGSGEKTIRLNKLNGNEWNKTKQKVKASTADMAKQLVALYAEREHTKGYAFSPDTPWQRDFEDTFAFAETQDQLRSIEEVKSDMESSKPMDRLLCGDVGYGKTEVALRAAFKAVTDSKQVIYLCPTTILAMQHYETFKKRMADFPVSIDMLSRFRTQKEQTQILKKLKTGEIDILIGTHRLLQKDVSFKDAGLLIIDEEQRFGVADKERIKELKKNIDVLSMTATPIPRTLHMAMLSVRDMSLLETPPENRYPVETYVLEYNPVILADAMKKELARGGQVFYLYNRVNGIYGAAEKIKKMIPEATVAVGHGKMHEDELEDIMYDMINGKTDILVCTTIIETGLDIPNANTIIIENADRMGLSQLYQLRGRVGRSNRSAYAYMTYKKDGVLSETASKRLSAIREFTEFGSGFKIAMRDLEIRGAGNILGAEQHGHMDSVGYDMYCRLLSESVKEASGIVQQQDVETSIDLSVDAYIPERYIRNANHRIDIYKQIAAVGTKEDSEDIIDELIDRFGTPPKAVINLIDIAVIKAMASECGITDISEKANRVIFTFLADSLTPDMVMELIKKFPKDIKIGASDIPQITYFIKDNKNKMTNIKFILQTINTLNNSL